MTVGLPLPVVAPTRAVPLVAVCILTYHRPEALRRLIATLARLRFERTPGVTPTFIVIDNDKNRSAEDVCREGFLAAGIDSYRYVVEPQRGISHARNRALEEAALHDLIAFLDDDEVPEPSWLDNLIDGMRQLGALIVSGPVETQFLSAPPDWIVAGPFFQRERYRTGHTLAETRTGNVLMQVATVRAAGVRFDPNLALTGGEDTCFFRQLALRGVKAFWVDDAVVTEWVSGSRLNLTWLLRRALRGGSTIAYCDVTLGTWWAGPDRAARGAFRIARGIGVLMTAPLRYPGRARATAARGLQQVFLGIGMFLGLLGVRYAEYADVRRRVSPTQSAQVDDTSSAY